MLRAMAFADPPPVLDGDVVAGKYRVDGVIGRGGMGVVLAATHLDLGTRVALKFLRAEDSANEAALERFRREARAGGQLRSEHAVRIFDVGSLPDGAPYLVMELLEGADLAGVLEASSGLALEDIVDWILQACDAIAEAHAAGIVHRDLKPRNLFLARRPSAEAQVKVLDFGIAKLLPGRGDPELTRSSEVLGSPVYMAPEQLRASRDVDARTDIWALGVILYELVTGRRPFVGESMSQVTASILEDTPPAVRDLRHDAPDELGRIIVRCMAKEPAARFASIAELRAALLSLRTLTPRARGGTVDYVSSGTAPTSLSWADTEPVRPPVRPRRRSGGRLPAFVGLAVLALLMGGVALARVKGSTKNAAHVVAPASPVALAVDAAVEAPALVAEPARVASPPSVVSATPKQSAGVMAKPRLAVRADAAAPAPTLGPSDFPDVRK